MAFFYIELYVIKITNTIFIKKKKQTISYLLLWHFFSPHIKDFDIVKKLLVGGICKLSHLQFLLIMTICVFFFFFVPARWESNYVIYIYFLFVHILQNKKQRMLVRQAVLKGKDPTKILQEMEMIDKMGEFLLFPNMSSWKKNF